MRARQASVFKSTDQIKADNPDLEAFETYDELLAAIKKANGLVGDTDMKYKSVDEIETLSFRDATLIRCIYSEKQGILEFEFDGAVVREDNSANELYTEQICQ